MGGEENSVFRIEKQRKKRRRTEEDETYLLPCHTGYARQGRRALHSPGQEMCAAPAHSHLCFPNAAPRASHPLMKALTLFPGLEIGDLCRGSTTPRASTACCISASTELLSSSTMCPRQICALGRMGGIQLRDVHQVSTWAARNEVFLPTEGRAIAGLCLL